MLDSAALSTSLLGLFLAGSLLLSRGRGANVWLGLFVLALSWMSIGDYFTAHQLYPRYPILWGAFDWPVAALGALLYCYTRSLTGIGNGMRQAWHFLPMALTVVTVLLVHGLTPREALQAALIADTKAPSSFDPVLLAYQLVAAAYVVAILFRLRQYRIRLRMNFSSTQGRELTWLSSLTICMSVLTLAWLEANILGGWWIWTLTVLRIGTMYALGWYGLRQAIVFQPGNLQGAAHPGADQAALATPFAELAVPGADGANTPSQAGLAKTTPLASGDSDDVAKASRYERSGMTEAVQEMIGARLAKQMNLEHAYRDNDINLSALAHTIGTSQQLLSQYINDVLGTNFFDYINHLRVAEVQRLMAEQRQDNLLDLAFAAGFNSRSTFNASFKKVTGVTPSAWRKKLDESST